MNPADNLIERFAELGPWIYQFEIDGQTYGGGISAVGDERVVEERDSHAVSSRRWEAAIES